MYAASPNNSTTSFSCSDDDEIKGIQASAYVYYPKDVVPAQWSSSPRGHKPQPTFQPSPASSLPPEILIQILQHLSSPRHLYSSVLVCRLWCECAVELLWYRPYFSDMSHLVQMLQVICSDNTAFDYARFIRRLNFTSLSKELTDSLFIRLQRCTKLDRLTLINCSELSDDAVARVVTNCKNLVALDLTNVKNCTDDTIKLLASTTPKLQALNVGGCKNITDESIVNLAESCSMLRRVKLCQLRHITDKSISALARNCPLLLEVDLHGCVKVTDTAIRDLWSHLPYLRDFRLSLCTDLTDNGFPASPENNHDVYTANHPYGTNLTDGFPPLLLSHSNIHLRLLDLTSCGNLTDDAIAGIISVAPKIRTLNLSRCSNLTDAAIESICKLGKQLHYLHLGHVSNITDRSIRTLARTCTRLRYIDLACCTHLTDLAVFELSTLVKLRRIGLVRLINLTDQAVFALADRHATLERIHLSYCENITVLAIHFLLTKLKHITHLSLTGIPAFRKPELQQFCRTVPRDYNTNQRAVFCVYSGKGIDNLRLYLANLMAHVDAQSGGMGVTDIDYDAEAEEDYVGINSHYPSYLSNYPTHLDYRPRISRVVVDDLPDDDDDGNEDQIIAREEIFEDGNNIALPVPSTIMTVRGRAGRMIVNRGGTPDSRPPIIEDINLSSVATTPSPTIRHSPSRTLSDPSTSETRGRFGQSPIVEAPSPSPQITPYASRHYLNSRTVRPSSHTSDEVSDHSGHSSRSNGVLADGVNGAGFYRSYAINGRPASDTISVARTGSYTPDLVYAEIGHGRGSSGAGPGPATLQHANERFRRASLSDHQNAVHVPNSESSPALNTSYMDLYRRQPAPLVTAGLRFRSAPSQSSELTARPDQHDITSPIPYLSSSPTTRQLQESVHSALTGYNSVSAGAAADLAASGYEDDADILRGRPVRRGLKNLTHTDATEHYASTLFGRAGTSSSDSLARDRAGSGSGTNGPSFINGRNAY